MTGIRAQEPAMAPPPFAPPAICEGRRTAGHVQVPDPSMDDAGPLEMSWKVASEGALDEPSPTKLRRTSSIAGNVLVAESAPGICEDDVNDITKKKAYWLQRKITEETRSHNYVRIGFPLQPYQVGEGEENAATASNGAWTVIKAAEGSMYPFEISAIKVQSHREVFPEDAASESDGDDNTSRSSSSPSKCIKHEITALQMIKKVDPLGEGNVLCAEHVIDDQVHVYIVVPYCKEGTLLDLIGATETGRLEESMARKYFANILNGLETLQKVHLCHRNLCMENILMRGDECQISSLGWALRVPTTQGEDGKPIVHLVEPQMVACGKNPAFIAPEVFASYENFDGYAIDLWAAGVILLSMLFGTDLLFAAPIPEDPKFQEICLQHHLKEVADKMQALMPGSTPVSDEAIDLLQNMLKAKPGDRFTLAQVQDHPWMKASS